MAPRKHRGSAVHPTLMSIAVAACFAAGSVHANPVGPSVVAGQASFSAAGSSLTVTNSPSAIINWQGFSIGSGEITRFIQQSAASAVLNRVVGGDVSQIYGQLLSNGQVFLINPGGIVVGPGAVVDTAGFVASTLNMLDADFLNGKLKFEGGADSGSIVNQGWIRTGSGGSVVLIAPQIENGGLIETPGGGLLLAAGRKLTITSLDQPGIEFEVQAPTDGVLNVGRLIADGGAVGVFAGTLRHSGDIRANSLTTDKAGRIVLQAASDVQLSAGSTTTADGGTGGSVTVQANGGLARVAGTVSAQGSSGSGGDIRILGEHVALTENAVVSASGTAGGGQVLVGGDFRGGNAAVQNASNTYVGDGATVRADATGQGDGGRVVVWSDDKTQFYGALSARGGSTGGDGGFAEVSGAQSLIFAGRADLGAPQGRLGTLLLDPLDLYVDARGGATTAITSNLDPTTEFPTNAATVTPDTLASVAGNIELYASRYMRISDPVTLTTAGQGLTATVGTYTAPSSPDPLSLSTGTVSNRLDIAADITTAGGAVSLTAPSIYGVASSTIATAGGAINLSAAASISGSSLSLDAGAGAVDVASTDNGAVSLASATGASLAVTAPSAIYISGPITTSGGAVALTSSGSYVYANGGITSGGGSVTLSGSSSINTSGTISAGGGDVSLGGSYVSAGTIDTTGAVTLNASSSSINATVNNASSLTATAAYGVTINSATDLNVANVTAGSTSTAYLSTTTGSILATGASSLVKGLDVSLYTTNGTGGGIGTSGTALNVDVQRNFTFRPNGDFNILLTGSGPVGLTAQLTPASTGTYSGTLAKSGGGLTLNATADTSTATVSSLDITSGFDQPVAFGNPFITVQSVNGANLVVASATVPTGDTQPTVSGVHTEAPLPVSFSSSGDLTVTSYARTAGGLAKSTSFSASGAVILGSVDASKDAVTITGPTGITVDSLVSTGSMTLTSSSGPVNAASDDSGVDISSGGTLTVTGRGIGTSAFSNPLDLAGSTISLTSNGGAAGAIGGANPVIADTQVLTVNAGSGSTFNISTGATSLTSLTVTANPIAVGDTGTAQVSTAGGGANYVFDADASGNFAFAPPTSTGRNVTFTSTTGDIALGSTDLGTGDFVLVANNGGIYTSGASISAANLALSAGTDIDTSAPLATPGNIAASTGNLALHARNSVTTGTLNAPGTLTIDGNYLCSFCYPDISVRTIGLSAAPATIAVSGGTVTVNGSVTGTGDITLAANSGLLTVGAIVTADGSTIDLTSSSGTPFQFDEIRAGVTGTVRVNSYGGISEQYPGVGITAQTIELRASSGDILGPDSGAGAAGLDLLNGTNPLDLTVDSGGQTLLNAHGNSLSSLTVIKRTGPSPDSFVISSLGGSQSVSIGGAGPDLDVAVSSPTALDFDLTYTTGDAIVLTGGGIASGGGNVSLTSYGGLDTTTGGISTGGGSATLNAYGATGITGGALTTGGGAVTMISYGPITSGGITTSNGSVSLTTYATGGNISVGGDFDAGSGSIQLNAYYGGNIDGAGRLTSTSSVSATTANGVIGTPAGLGPATPLAVTSPTVTLVANRGSSASGSEGTVLADLTGTSSLNLTGDYGFTVNSLDTALTTLSVTTKGTGAGTLTLTAPGQTFSFDRPATDLFGAAVAGTTFEVVSVSAPGATATFTASDGNLLVRGASGGANRIDVQNLTLAATGGGDVSLQGTSASPLLLSSATQAFNASSATTADVLIHGKVTLDATSGQSFSAYGNITVDADAGGGGGVTISAPDQSFSVYGGSSTIKLLGGAAAGEKVAVTATNQQQISTPSSSVDSFRLQGGSGQDASVTLSHSGSGVQDFNMQYGTVTVAGGSGQNAFAKIEETGTNQQRICYDTYYGCIAVGSLQILGGSGTGAYAQITASGSQYVGVSNSTLIQGGTGDGANALLQAGTSQTIFGYGDLTVEGQGGTGATAKAEILANGSQTIYAGDVAVQAGGSAGSLARISTTGGQYLYGYSLALTAGGAGQTAEPFVAVPGASAIIEGQNQYLSISGSITLNGGAGISGNTADALLRNLSGNQNIYASGSLTLNGGHTQSTTGIINAGTGTQTISAYGGLLLQSDPNLAPAHVDSSVLIENQAATLQTISAANGGATLLNSGDGTVAVSSAGTQTVTTRFVEVSTETGSTGNATLSAAGDQRIHTTAENADGYSLLVAALGSGTASIESGASQLLEIGYPDIMTGSTSLGVLQIGGANGAGTSNVKAVDQSVFAGSIVVESGNSGSVAELGASNDQEISTLLGGILVQGGGDNTVAKIGGSVNQTVVANGDISIVGGSSSTAATQIANGSGTQTLFTTNGDVTLRSDGAGSVEVSSGGDQSIGALVGGLSLSTGGAGSATVSAGGAQSVNAGLVSLFANAGATGGVTLSATGTQSIDASGDGLTLSNGGSGNVEVSAAGTQTVNATLIDLFGGSGSTGGVTLGAAGDQSLSATAGGLTLGNNGSGSVEATAGGAQTVTAVYVDVTTGTGSTGSAKLAATGDQSIHTTGEAASPDPGRSVPAALPNYGLRVAAFGTGTASIESGATQLLNVTYPEVTDNPALTGGLIVGGTAEGVPVAGTSRITAAVDQTIFAGAIWVETGLNAGSPTLQQFSEIKAGNNQDITTTGDIWILGGAGNDTIAQIDPINQTISVGGDLTILGGSGTNAVAQIVNGTGSQMLSIGGNITLLGGSGVGADALVISDGVQIVSALGSVSLNNGLNSLTGGVGGIASITLRGGGSQSTGVTYGASPVALIEDYLIDLVYTVLPVEDTDLLTRRVPICR